ncbi:MAG TPA: DUF1592 domain-containing protein [Polyangiaceae bacterium]|nr:DUF1592 domain-containing protein [Polyangiaceae bacterium]
MSRGSALIWSLVCGAAVLGACSSSAERSASAPASSFSNGSSSPTGGTSTASAGATGTDFGGGNSSGGAGSSDADSALAHLPTRIRRLANVEYDTSVQVLLSTKRSLAGGPDFPPDLRQDGFTVNDTQRIDAVLVERLADAADTLVDEAKQNGTFARLAPCETAADAANCAKRFIVTFGAKVYRRPLDDEEIEALMGLYSVGAEAASFQDGIAHVTRGLLQSAGFLYLTELGEGQPASDGTVRLTAHELAASLSYFLTSAPPDAELLQKASSGALFEPDEREAQARRLFEANPAARDTVVRLVREWLGIDRIAESSKDSLVYPEFAEEKPKIVAESQDFVRAVAFESTGTVGELLGANWTVNSGPLSLYEVAGAGPLPGSSRLTGRIGILNQGAFLATYANAHESHPIFRGVAVTRRVVCYPLDSPASFNLQVVPPAPDPSLTTRERFSVHPRDSICAGCHDIVDPFGFSFEQFDGMGRYRERENGKQIDSAVRVAMDAEFDGPYADSNALAAALSDSEIVRECFARFMFRAASATGDSAATPGEREFVDAWRKIPEAARGNIVETLIAYVKSPSFAVRGGP